jgi:hypothetical protein
MQSAISLLKSHIPTMKVCNFTKEKQAKQESTRLPSDLLSISLLTPLY